MGNQMLLILPVAGVKRIEGRRHSRDCGCDWCLMDYVSAPTCGKCGLRGAHECVTDAVTIAGTRYEATEYE